MTPETEKIRAADARALLDNQLFKEAFAKVGEHIESQALTCDPDNKERAQRIVMAKQLLAGVRREVERVVEDGEFAEIKMAEIEKKRSIFRR